MRWGKHVMKPAITSSWRCAHVNIIDQPGSIFPLGSLPTAANSQTMGRISDAKAEVGGRDITQTMAGEVATMGD